MGRAPRTPGTARKARLVAALAGILEAAKGEGRETRYTVTPEPLEEAVEWIVQAGGEWDERLARLGTYVAGDRSL